MTLRSVLWLFCPLFFGQSPEDRKKFPYLEDNVLIHPPVMRPISSIFESGLRGAGRGNAFPVRAKMHQPNLRPRSPRPGPRGKDAGQPP